MNRFEDIEKKIQIKLSGQDKRSYLDIAKKQASSALIIDQEEQESNLSQSRCSYLPSYQLQSSLHFSTSISEITKAEKESMNKTIIAHNIGDIKIEQILKRKEEKDDQIKVFYTNNIQTDQDSNSSQKCKKASVLNKQTNSKQFKKSIYYDKQKKMSVLNQKKEPKKKVNYAQRTENIYDKMKPKLTNFINKFTLFGRFKQMTEQSRILLGDLSDKSNYIRNYQKYSTFRQLLEMFLLVLKNMEKLVIIIFEKIPLFNPENKFRILINSLIACYNCFYLFTISLTLFFQAQFGHYGHLFHNVAIAAWIIEMILQMNTATYHDGDFVTDRKTIFRIYVKEYFFFEVLPLIFEGKASSNSAVNILLHLPLLLKLKGIVSHPLAFAQTSSIIDLQINVINIASGSYYGMFLCNSGSF